MKVNLKYSFTNQITLRFQRKALTLTLTALMAGSMVSCVSFTPGHYDHAGISTLSTPYDSKYQKVQYSQNYYNPTGIFTPATPYDKEYQKVQYSPNYYSPTGIFTPATPYDSKYQKVHEYLETASSFEDKADAKGADYWQSPSETERLGTGDCDDKAIWLYSKLTKEGIDNIRLVLGNYKSGELSVHMWVNWYQDGEVFILDPTIDNGIRSSFEYWTDYYQPFYSFHKGKKWEHFSSLN